MNMDAVLRIAAKITGLADLGKLQQGLVKVESAAKDVRSSIGTVVSSASFQAVAGASAALAAGLGFAAAEAMRFESSMADVRKVVSGLETETAFKEIQNEILDLTKTIPVAAEGFAEIYAAAGQSGIAREELKDFATLVAQVGIAFDMTAADAGTALSQMRVALNMSTDELRQFADQMNYVSNNSGATASNLVEFMKRAGSAGQLAGFAASETMALGAAMIQAGNEAEVAATSFRNMVRALSAGPNMTDKQIGALNKLGYALQTADTYEAELTRAVERESRLRIDAARNESDELRREIDRRYRDQLTAIQDSVSDQYDAAEEGIRDRSDAEVKALRREQEALVKAARERSRQSGADSDQEIQRINDDYEARIDAIQDRVNDELKLQRRAERDRLVRIRDEMEDRKQIEVSAVEDRQKAIEEQEKAYLATQKEAAKQRAEELAAESAQAFADQFQADSIGLVTEVFRKISELPKAQQISMMSSLFGDEARALAPVLANMDEFQRLLRLAANEGAAAGSVLQEFSVRSETTANKLQLINNQLKISQIIVGSQVLKAFESLDKVIGPVLNKFAQFAEANPGIAQGLIILTSALTGIVLLAPGILAIVKLLGMLAALKLGATIAGWAGAIVPLMGALKGLGALILGVFTGPVGWIALAVAAGVAIYAFRDQIADAFKVIGDVIKGAAEFFYNSYVKPVITAGDLVVRGLKSAFDSLASILTNPFKTAVESIKNLFRSVRDTAGNLVSGLKSAFSSLASILSSPFKTAVESIKNLF
ncbi:MAG: phage tail tape measure protein, partial [Pseudohongiellaceae bacterium]